MIPSRHRLSVAFSFLLALSGLSTGCESGSGTTPTPSDGGQLDGADSTGDVADADEPDSNEPRGDATADASSDAGADVGSSAKCLDPAFDGPASGTCQSQPAPERCDASLDGFSDWGPASAVTTLEFTTQRANDRAMDLDGSGDADNAISNIFGALTFFDVDIDTQLASKIAGGELLLVLEHQTDGGDLSSTFPVNAYRASYAAEGQTDVEASGTPYEIRTTSLSSGTFPHSRLSQASVSGGAFEGGPGRLDLELELTYFDLTLPIRGLRLKADATTPGQSPAAEGVALTGGRLGGYVLLRDLYGILDQLFGQCACLDFPDQVFTVPKPSAGDPDICDGGLDVPSCEVNCAPGPKQKAGSCTVEDDGSICGNLNKACRVADTIKSFADLDVDCDGTVDAVSVGAAVEASGGVVQGVAETVTASNQTVAADGPTLTVDRAYLEKERWIALRAVAPDGTPGEVFGHVSDPLSAGSHSDLQIEVDGQLEDGWGLFAVVHESNGDDQFEFDPSQQSSPDGPVTDPTGSAVSSRFAVDVE